MNDDRLIQAIATDVEDCDNKVRQIASASQARYRATLAPGSVVRDFGEFAPADDKGREDIRSVVADAIDEIAEDIEGHIRAAARSLSEPAHADDAATVALTLARERVDENELQALLDRYKNNYQLSAAVCERAHRAGFFLDGEPEQVRIFRSDASERAHRLASRYNEGGLWLSPESFADEVVRALRHVDMLGRPY